MLAQIDQKELLYALVVLFVFLGGALVVWKNLTKKETMPVRVENGAPVPNPLTIRIEEGLVPIAVFQKFEKYVHDENHKIHDIFHQQNLVIEERRLETADQITALSGKIDEGFKILDSQRRTSIGNLHSDLKKAELKLATLEADAKSTLRVVDRLEVKLDKVVDRISDEVKDLLKGHRP